MSEAISAVLLGIWAGSSADFTAALQQRPLEVSCVLLSKALLKPLDAIEMLTYNNNNNNKGIFSSPCVELPFGDGICVCLGEHWI